MIFGMTKSNQDLRVNTDRFTIGTYYVAFFASQAAKRVTDMQTIKNLGYDYVCTPCASGDTALFAKLQELGLGLMIEYNEEPFSGVLSAADAYGIVIGHVPGDDVDINFANAAAFAATETAYQALDTNKLTLCSTANTFANADEFAGTSDLFGAQCYPMTAETFEVMAYHYVPAKTECVAANVPFLAHVQTSMFEGDRVPTPSEFLVMAWGAIQFGADGILMYAAYDCKIVAGPTYETITDIFTAANMPLRCAIKTFIVDVRRYEHFFLRGTRSNSYDANGVETTWADSVTGQTLRIVNDFDTETVTITIES